MMRAILFSAAVVATRASCYWENENFKAKAGHAIGYYCEGMDGTHDTSYHANFHSVNNDKFSVQARASQDPGDHCWKPWKTWLTRHYDDNFDHSESYWLSSGGTYVHIQQCIVFTCETPGTGKECEVAIAKMKSCNGKSCGFTLGANATASKAASSKPTASNATTRE